MNQDKKGKKENYSSSVSDGTNLMIGNPGYFEYRMDQMGLDNPYERIDYMKDIYNVRQNDDPSPEEDWRKELEKQDELYAKNQKALAQEKEELNERLARSRHLKFNAASKIYERQAANAAATPGLEDDYQVRNELPGKLQESVYDASVTLEEMDEFSL